MDQWGSGRVLFLSRRLVNKVRGFILVLSWCLCASSCSGPIFGPEIATEPIQGSFCRDLPKDLPQAGIGHRGGPLWASAIGTSILHLRD